MLSGHGANPIFFNKKKIGRPEHSACQAYPKYPKSKFINSLQYLKKEVRDEVNFFCMQINIKLSYKLIPSILLGIAKPAQMTSLQNLLAVAMIFDVRGQTCLKCSK